MHVRRCLDETGFGVSNDVPPARASQVGSLETLGSLNELIFNLQNNSQQSISQKYPDALVGLFRVASDVPPHPAKPRKEQVK